MTQTQLDLTADYIDVRDIIARVEELNDEIDAESFADAPQDEADEVRSELATLTAILDDLRGNGGDEQWEGDWYPVTLIRDSYFETAMDELLEDIGNLPKDLPCYLKVTVDYDALQMDYTSTEIDGETYWYR
jgi:hypothetical protein